MKYDLTKANLDYDLKWLKEPNNVLNDYGDVVRHLLNEVDELKQLSIPLVSFTLPSDAEITKYVKDLQPPKGCDKFSVDTGFVKGAIYMRELANNKNLKGN